MRELFLELTEALKEGETYHLSLEQMVVVLTALEIAGEM